MCLPNCDFTTAVQNVPVLQMGHCQTFVMQWPASVPVVPTSMGWPVRGVPKDTGNHCCQDAVNPAAVTPPGHTVTPVTRYDLHPATPRCHLQQLSSSYCLNNSLKPNIFRHWYNVIVVGNNTKFTSVSFLPGDRSVSVQTKLWRPNMYRVSRQHIWRPSLRLPAWVSPLWLLHLLLTGHLLYVVNLGFTY